VFIQVQEFIVVVRFRNQKFALTGHRAVLRFPQQTVLKPPPFLFICVISCSSLAESVELNSMPVHGSFSFAQDKKNSVAHCCAELRVKA
jgi:hypothetical protein